MPGKYANVSGQAACTNCEAGKWSTDYRRASSCTTPCDPGSYCASGGMPPVRCPAGRFSAAAGMADASACMPCDAGKFSLDTGRAVPCSSLCSVGYYCDSGANSSPQNACPAGRFGNVTGLSNAMCSGPCAAAAGSYCGPSATRPSSELCGAGRFGNISGLLSSLCSGACSGAPGRYCGVGTVTETACAEGYFCATPTARAPCPAGATCPASSIASVPCTMGTFSSPGSTSCYPLSFAAIVQSVAGAASTVSISVTFTRTVRGLLGGADALTPACFNLTQLPDAGGSRLGTPTVALVAGTGASWTLTLNTSLGLLRGNERVALDVVAGAVADDNGGLVLLSAPLTLRLPRKAPPVLVSATATAANDIRLVFDEPVFVAVEAASVAAVSVDAFTLALMGGGDGQALMGSTLIVELADAGGGITSMLLRLRLARSVAGTETVTVRLLPHRVRDATGNVAAEVTRSVPLALAADVSACTEFTMTVVGLQIDGSAAPLGLSRNSSAAFVWVVASHAGVSPAQVELLSAVPVPVLVRRRRQAALLPSMWPSRRLALGVPGASVRFAVAWLPPAATAAFKVALSDTSLTGFAAGLRASSDPAFAAVTFVQLAAAPVLLCAPGRGVTTGGATGDFCALCPSGAYSAGGTDAVCGAQACPVGWGVTAGLLGAASINESCARCGAGSFSPGGAAACNATTCAAGKVPPTSGASDAVLNCSACPAGSFAPSGAMSCANMSCAQGEYTDRNGSSSALDGCTRCGAGTFKDFQIPFNSTMACRPCLSHVTSSSSGAMRCIDCARDHNRVNDRCEPCPGGAESNGWWPVLLVAVEIMMVLILAGLVFRGYTQANPLGLRKVTVVLHALQELAWVLSIHVGGRGQDVAQWGPVLSAVKQLAERLTASVQPPPWGCGWGMADGPEVRGTNQIETGVLTAIAGLLLLVVLPFSGALVYRGQLHRHARVAIEHIARDGTDAARAELERLVMRPARWLRLLRLSIFRFYLLIAPLVVPSFIGVLLGGLRRCIIGNDDDKGATPLDVDVPCDQTKLGVIAASCVGAAFLALVHPIGVVAFVRAVVSGRFRSLQMSAFHKRAIASVAADATPSSDRYAPPNPTHRSPLLDAAVLLRYGALYEPYTVRAPWWEASCLLAVRRSLGC